MYAGVVILLPDFPYDSFEALRLKTSHRYKCTSILRTFRPWPTLF